MAGLARRTIPSVAAVVLIAVLVSRLGAGPFLRAVHTLDLRTAAAALAIGALTTLASAWRWVRAARGLGLTLDRRRAVGDYYAALFLNGVLPGGVLGDVQRALRHGRDAQNQRRAVTAVLVERTAGQIVLVVAAVTCVLLRPSVLPAHLVPSGAAHAAVLVLVLAAGALALLARSRRLVGPADSVAVLGASIVVLAGHLATFVVAARAAGSVASVLSLLPLMLVALLAMSLPLNIAGWGPREGVTAWAFASAGMQAGQGLTVAVLYGLLALVASLPGAAVLAVRFVAPRFLAHGRRTRPSQSPACSVTSSPTTNRRSSSPSTSPSRPAEAAAGSPAEASSRSVGPLRQGLPVDGRGSACRLPPYARAVGRRRCDIRAVGSTRSRR